MTEPVLAVTPTPSPDDCADRERRLVAAALAGDDRAFAELVRRVHTMVYGVCLHITGDVHEAQDATQAAWTAAWRHLSTFRGHARFSTWLHPIAARAALAVVRKRDRAAAGELPAEIGAPYRPPDQVVADVDVVRRAMAQLPPTFRAALVLREAFGLSYREIADIEDVRVETVKTRIARARRRVASLLLEAGA